MWRHGRRTYSPTPSSDPGTPHFPARVLTPPPTQRHTYTHAQRQNALRHATPTHAMPHNLRHSPATSHRNGHIHSTSCRAAPRMAHNVHTHVHKHVYIRRYTCRYTFIHTQYTSLFTSRRVYAHVLRGLTRRMQLLPVSRTRMLPYTSARRSSGL